MIRLTLVLATWMSLFSVVSASLVPRKASSPLGKEAQVSKLSGRTLEQAAGVQDRSEFIVTERTEILLDGKPCKYADVPQQARIVLMEVAADNKTVLKIHFRTEK
jgi:hypothetical protein